MDSEWDAFISYASEDKAKVAKPLALLLKSFGLKVWFDEFEIGLGDVWPQKISEGLSKSKYGIFIISPQFVSKRNWTETELNTFFVTVKLTDGRILPIRHNISQSELIQFNTLLASIQNVSTENDMDFLVQKIMNKIQPDNSYYNFNELPLTVKPNTLKLSFGEWHIVDNNDIYIQNLSDTPIYAVELAYSIQSKDLTLSDIKIENPHSTGFSLSMVGNKDGQTQIRAIPRKAM